MSDLKYTLSKTHGVTLQELLIALGIIGLISAFLIPTFINSGTSRVTNTKHNASEEILQNALETANGQVGLLPVNYGPGRALQPYVKGKKFDIPDFSDVPTACKTMPKVDGVDVVQDGDYHTTLPNNAQVYGLSPTWNTGIINARNQAVDPVCVITN